MITPCFGITATERVLPRLALDFTSAVLDPRITFARAAATATRVNASGLIEVVAADTPRFDYTPLTPVCRGLLVEETRTNGILYSEQFENAYWTKTQLTISSDFETSPDGTANADKLVANTANASRHIQAAGVTVGSGNTYTVSVYAKFAGVRFLYINAFDSVSRFTYFDLQNGTLGTNAAGSTASITNAGNGWYRCTVTRAASTNDVFMFFGMCTTNGVPTYVGDGASGISLWGAQLEAGAFPTSYIPTTTTALTRNADVATITGTDFSDWWQAGRGGALVQAIPSTVSGTRPLIQFDDNTADEIIALRGNGADPELYIVDGGAPQAQIDAGTIAAGTPYTLTGWWQTDFCAARKDNGARVVDNSATVPTVTQARLGSDGTNYLNGHLATINYYDRFSGQIYTRRKNKAVFSVL